MFELTMNILQHQEGGTHYKQCAIQPIEFISANNLNFSEGNIVKYTTRHKSKNKDEDIKKVIHYAKFILKFEYNYTDEQLKEL